VAAERVVLVIPLLDERATMDGLLDDCRRLDPAPDEVVAVDAGSGDGTRERLQELARAWPALRLVDAPGAHPGAARDAGIRASDAPLVVTLDAGSRIGPGWLGALTAPVAAAPRTFAVGVVEPDARSAFERAAGWSTVRAFKSAAGAGALAGRALPAGRSGYCFRRGSWAEAGGYPAARWSEDKLFAARLLDRGHTLVVVGEAVVHWRPRTSPAALFRQYAYYSRADMRAGLDRRNSMPTVAAAAALAALLRAGPAGRAVAATGAAAYLATYVRRAAGDGLDGEALAWVPVVRAAVDSGKVSGCLRGALEVAVGRVAKSP
jgi:cellulose synthase/poly-beta-1,6-N-acetylglucosamine synthase-like glycosyltransferase